MKYICEAEDDIAKWEQKMKDAGARRATVEEMLSIGDNVDDDDDVKQTGYCEHILMPDDEERLKEIDEEEGYPDLPMDILPQMTDEELKNSIIEDLCSLQEVVVADDDHCLS
jgi:hypothetical protein